MFDMAFFIAIILVFGFALLFLEVFLIPGFGFFGVGGIMAVSVGCFFTWTEFGQLPGILLTFCSIVLSIGFVVIFLKSRASKKFVLEQRQEAKCADKLGKPGLELLLKKEGIVTSFLRPSGIAEIDGNRYDVISESEFLEVGTKIKVIKVEGTKILVSKLDD
ncbi:MAG: NfeD family protein [Pseudomonadota bacterium]